MHGPQLNPVLRDIVPDRGWWRPTTRVPKASSGLAVEPDKKASLALKALVGFTFVLLIAPQEHFKALGVLHLGVITAVGAAVALIYDRSRQGQRILASGRAVNLSIALACWTLFTIPFSMWPSGSFTLFTSVYFKSIIIFLILGAAIDTSANLRRLAQALTLFAVPVALTAIANFAEHKFIGGKQGLERIVGYEAGLTGNPNDLALLLNLILPLTAALFLSHKGGLGRALLGIAIVLDAGAVVATFSRAGFLTLAFVFVMLTWRLRNRPERVYTWAAMGLALFGLLLLPAGYLGHLGTITNISHDSTGSAQERSRDMLTALGLISSRPFVGAGLGNNILALNAERGATWRMVHNVYLQYATDLGLPGLFLFLALFWSCLSALRKAIRRLRAAASNRELLNLAEGVQLSLFAFGLAAFFHPAGYNFDFFYMAGLAIAVHGIAFGRAGQTARTA